MNTFDLNTEFLVEEDSPMVAAPGTGVLVEEDSPMVAAPGNDILSVSSSVAPWPSRLPFDVAMGETPEHLSSIYNVSLQQIEALNYIPAFRHEVAKHEKEIRENGVTFKAKARVQAEMYLEEVHTLIHAAETPPSVRLDAIKSVVKWGGLEPAPVKEATAPGQNTSTKIEIAWMPVQDSPALAARITTTNA